MFNSRLKVNTIKNNNISDLQSNYKETDTNNKTKDEYDVPTKFIFKPYIARRLIKNHNLIDIRPDKNDPVRTVFVFEDSIRLRDDMQKILKERKNDEKDFNANVYEGETKIIFKPYIARRLNHNHQIVDIKPDKNEPKKTIFVFADSIELRDDMQRILRNREIKKDSQEISEDEV